MDVGIAWIARGTALSLAGRADEAADAARRAREIYERMGFVDGIRRVDAMLGG
jgi:hypothetical protein